MGLNWFIVFPSVRPSFVDGRTCPRKRDSFACESELTTEKIRKFTIYYIDKDQWIVWSVSNHLLDGYKNGRIWTVKFTHIVMDFFIGFWFQWMWMHHWPQPQEPRFAMQTIWHEIVAHAVFTLVRHSDYPETEPGMKLEQLYFSV